MKNSGKKKSNSSKHSLGIEFREMFIGYRTVFSLLGFAIGGILVGKTLCEYVELYLGMPAAILIGVIIFSVSGILSGNFKK